MRTELGACALALAVMAGGSASAAQSAGLVRATVPFAETPTGVAAGPDGTTAYVAVSAGGRSRLVTLRKRGDGVARASTSDLPASADGGIAIDAPGTHLWAADERRGRVWTSLLPAADAGAGAVAVGGKPVALTMRGALLYVAVERGGEGDVVVVDTLRRRVLARTALARPPRALALSADGSTLWCATAGGIAAYAVAASGVPGDAIAGMRLAPGDVSAVAVLQGTATIAFAESQWFDRSGPPQQAAAVTLGTDGVPAIRNGFRVGRGPHVFALSPDRSLLYVLNAGSRTLQVVDAARLTQPGE